jgi:hypothetical protein
MIGLVVQRQTLKVAYIRLRKPGPVTRLCSNVPNVTHVQIRIFDDHDGFNVRSIFFERDLSLSHQKGQNMRRGRRRGNHRVCLKFVGGFHFVVIIVSEKKKK